MGIEIILIDGKRTKTLKELLGPNLRVIVVGLNPAPRSVEAGHYYQGALGQRFWKRIIDFGIVAKLDKGAEDSCAFRQGLGFCDLVRRPTGRASELSEKEKREAVPNLLKRLKKATGKPPLLFVFAVAWRMAARDLEAAGYRIFRMPSPFASRKEVAQRMKQLRKAIPRPRHGRA